MFVVQSCMFVSSKGGPGEEQKEGSIMVEFDDGDRGWISLSNIRLLPPGYQIHCTFLQINTFHLHYKQSVVFCNARHCAKFPCLSLSLWHCWWSAGAEPSPAHLVSPSCRRRKASTQEKMSQQADVSSECSANTEPRKNVVKAKPGAWWQLWSPTFLRFPKFHIGWIKHIFSYTF